MNEAYKNSNFKFSFHERGGVAPIFWADVDIVPERSEWDAIRVG